MTVFLAYEDNHGLICIGESYKAAVEFLIRNDWIRSDTLLADGNDSWISVKRQFGKHWRENIRNLGHFTFNIYFDGVLSIIERKVEQY